VFKFLRRVAKFLGELVGIARPAAELGKIGREVVDPDPSPPPIPLSPRAISKPPPTRH